MSSHVPFKRRVSVDLRQSIKTRSESLNDKPTDKLTVGDLEVALSDLFENYKISNYLQRETPRIDFVYRKKEDVGRTGFRLILPPGSSFVTEHEVLLIILGIFYSERDHVRFGIGNDTKRSKIWLREVAPFALSREHLLIDVLRESARLLGKNYVELHEDLKEAHLDGFEVTFWLSLNAKVMRSNPVLLGETAPREIQAALKNDLKALNVCDDLIAVSELSNGTLGAISIPPAWGWIDKRYAHVVIDVEKDAALALRLPQTFCIHLQPRRPVRPDVDEGKTT